MKNIEREEEEEGEEEENIADLPLRKSEILISF